VGPARPRPVARSLTRQTRRGSVRAVTTFAELNEQKTPAQARQDITIKSEHAIAINDIRTQITRLRLLAQQTDTKADPKAIAQLEGKLADAVEEANAAGAVYTFVAQAIGRDKWRALVEQHPPTAKQLADHNARHPDPEAKGYVPPPDFNGDTFPPVAISEAMIDPVITLDEATAMWRNNDGTWNEGELRLILDCAIRANRGVVFVDLGKD
jgi:hypothetical protein